VRRLARSRSRRGVLEPHCIRWLLRRFHGLADSVRLAGRTGPTRTVKGRRPVDPKETLLEDVLKPAVVATHGLVGSEPCPKLLHLAMKMYGLEMLAHLSESDRPGIFVPVDFVQDGKDLAGCVLTLQDRAIFAWHTGTFRIKNFETVVPYSTVTHVEEGTRPGTRNCVALSTLRVSAERDWTLVFNHVLIGATIPLPTLLADTLQGSITYNRD
jgi:hypothetical protein